MAVGVFAQEDTTENSIFDFDNTLMDAEATIFAEDESMPVEDGKASTSTTEMSSTDEELQQSLDWIQDLYNTFCVTEEDGGMRFL